MLQHQVNFKFDGLIAAERHLLDASDGNSFHDGARQVLALHAYAFIHGHVPRGGAVNHTDYYQILNAPARQGCIEYPYIVDLLQSFTHGFAGAAGAFTFAHFFEEQLKALFGRVQGRNPPQLPDRGGVILKQKDGNGAPLIELESEAALAAKKFQDRIRLSSIAMLRPIGRSATSLTIWSAEVAPIVLGPDDLTFLKQAQITQALQQMRSQGRLQPKHM